MKSVNPPQSASHPGIDTIGASHAALNEEAVAQLLKHSLTIPARPETLIRIEELAERPDISITAIARAIKCDAAITAMIFRAINSPTYGLNRKIETIDRAIAILGLATTLNLVKAFALRSAVSGHGPFLDWFWERSLNIATFGAAVAADRVTVCNIFPDQAYLVGLFHAVGVPLLLQRFPDYSRQLDLEHLTAWPDRRTEERLYGTTYPLVGYWVATHWRLPRFICDAIRCQHEYLSVEHSARSMVAMLQLAIHLSNRHRSIIEPEWESRAAFVREELGIAADAGDEYEEEILDRVAREQRAY